jgi:Domain of unknown function (DUF4258)
MIRYDQHAKFQLERRGIAQEWVEETILNPDETETKGNRLSYLKCLPNRDIMLHVITPVDDPQYVITAYFDRRKPCA